VIEKAVILSTGDELTSGLTVDTNSNFLADKLFEIGVDLVAVVTVGDDAERIRWAFTSGLDRADLVIATGGLGPTADDLTTETLAAALGRKLHFDEESAEHIRALFRSIGRTMPENNLRQATFPEGAVILANPLGTAPGYRVEVDWKGKRRFVVVMPGVPREMKPMMEMTVLPWIRSLDESGLVYRSRSFQTFGASESALDEMMAGAISPDEGRLSFRAAFPQISVRVTAHGLPGEVDEKLARLGERVRSRIGDYVFGEAAATMEAVVEDLLRTRGWKLATAESVTGGLIADRLTNVPGSSQVFVGGLVAYTLEAKEATLGVRRDTLELHGAVSEATAKEMAAGARRALGADVAVSATGIAGPDGGTPQTPIGTVYVGLAADGMEVAKRYALWGTRDWIRLLASQIALDWVRRHALGRRPEESLLIRK
jgi:nicotinamide-nucleotide amidase